ncbi:hypothetical protein SLEP1_g48821 [Rubroshorea leprosula]|uniref:Uncharacterized protein n=1 Tax=Rubroshorea leprosula TaxID=152421 RepID=A0AAV5LVQ1_9ROSI|nr:hypothetical protein SLEP1_g48821 [Rubroshorea leprosula]
MLATPSLISCNFSYPPLKSSRLRISPKVRNFYHISSIPNCRISKCLVSLKPQNEKGGILQICRSSLNTQKPEENPDVDKGSSVFESNGKEGKNWTTSILLFGLWGALMYYVFNLTPNQTPSRDMYFLQKLLNLKGDDGYRMNDVLVSLWYIMGLWPLVYSMLMLPTARRYHLNYIEALVPLSERLYHWVGYQSCKSNSPVPDIRLIASIIADSNLYTPWWILEFLSNQM